MTQECLSAFVKTYIMPTDVLACAESLFERPDREWTQHQYVKPEQGGRSESVRFGDTEPSVSVCADEYEQLLNFLCSCLRDYFDEFPRSSSPSMSRIRLNRYVKNQLMKPHVDHITSAFDGTRRGVPVLSLVGLVNKAEEGGEFFMNFRDGYKEYLINKGELLIFPSSFLFEHEVKPVKEGVRDSFVSWTFF